MPRSPRSSPSEPASPGASPDQAPHDRRLVAPALAAWAGAAIATHEHLHLTVVIALLAVVLTAVAALLRRWRTAATVLALLAAAMVGELWLLPLRSGPVSEWAGHGAAVTCTGRISGDIRVLPRQGVRPALALGTLRVAECTGRGRRVMTAVPLALRATGDEVTRLSGLVAGSSVRVTGLLQAPRPGDAVIGSLTVRAPPEVLSGPNWHERAVNRVRRALVESMRASPPVQAGLVPSLVVGDTSHLPPQTVEAFRSTGLTHLTAVSGSNLALTLVFLLTAARWCGVRGWWLRGTAVVGVAAFVVVCRGEPSVVRAAAMGIVALAALGHGRGAGRGLRHLAVAVLVLMLVDPWLSRSWGFALSVVASAGLLVWAEPWRRLLSRWLPGWVAEAVAVPLSAQIATQPLVTALNGQVSTTGLVANALAGPFVGPATVLGLLAALAGVISPTLALGFGWLAGWVVQPIIEVATRGARLPASTWTWRADAAGVSLLAALCLALGWVVPHLLRRPWLVIIAALIILAAMVRQPSPPGWPGPWRLVVCSVGQGDASLLKSGPGQAVLVDAGPDPGPVLRCLRAVGVRSLPLVVLTHFHDDHIAGLAAVLDTFPVGAVVVSPLASPSGSATRARELVARHHITVHVALPGQHWAVGEASYRVVRAGPVFSLASTGEGESSAENDSSVMGVGQSGNLTVLLPGDAEPAAQQAAVAARADLHAQVLKMPHHGSARQDPAFWRSTGAGLAIASAGVDNDYGHPAKAALRLAATCGMAVARTDTEGSVAVWVDANRLQVRTSQSA